MILTLTSLAEADSGEADAAAAAAAEAAEAAPSPEFSAPVLALLCETWSQMAHYFQCWRIRPTYHSMG